jgi:hypothetical protein
MKNHIADRVINMPSDFIQEFLDDPNIREAREWLSKATEHDIRSLGESGSSEEARRLIDEIYKAGAAEVLVVDIDEDEIDEQRVLQNSGRLVIKLPESPAEREPLFAWAACNSESHGFDADEDTGQSHLFVMLD